LIRTLIHPLIHTLRYPFAPCANYVPVTSADRLLDYFGVVRDREDPQHDLFPMGLAPFIWLAPDGTQPTKSMRFVDDSIFRFVPDFIAKLDRARGTYNARSKTVHEKKTSGAPGPMASAATFRPKPFTNRIMKAALQYVGR
jgi:hypothetical protein